MTTRFRTIALWSTLAALPASAAAQPTSPSADALAEQSLEALMAVRVDTVSGAAKREQLVTEAPSSVTVITADEIATYGWRTLGEVLRAVRGFHVTYDRNYTYLGARGFGRPSDYNNRVLVLLNGHRINDNVYDATGLGSDFPVDLQLVDRIEVIRGPGSALYGTSAFFAVVDVITRRGGGLGGVEGSIESASLGTWRSRASYGRTDSRGRDLLVSASWLSSAGAGTLHFPEYDDPATGPGVSRDADGERAGSAFASLRMGGLTLEGAFVDRDKTLPAGAWDTNLGDPRSRTVDRRAWAGATWHGDVAGAQVTARVFQDHMRYDGRYSLVDASVFDEYATGDWTSGELTASRRVGGAHRITGGSEYREHLRQLQTIDVGDGMQDDSRRSRQLGLYLQDEWALTPTLSTVLGVRGDYWSLDGWSANPRVGVIWRPDADTALKLLYGSAFRAANAYERFYAQGAFIANPALRPERLRTAEVVGERYVSGRLRLTGSAYVTRITGLVSQFETGDLAWYENGGEVEAVGVEFEGERRWTSGVVVRGSVTRQRTREHPAHVALSNSPVSLGTARIQAPLGRRTMTIAADWQAVAARLSMRGVRADAYQLTHLTWRWTPRPRVAIATSVYNVFDTAHAQPVGLEFRQDVLWQDRRTASVRLTVGF